MDTHREKKDCGVFGSPAGECDDGFDVIFLIYLILHQSQYVRGVCDLTLNGRKYDEHKSDKKK